MFKATKVKRDKNWYDGECKKLKSLTKNFSKKIRSDPYNNNLTQEFYKLKKMYKSLIKKNKRPFQQHIWQKREHLEKQKPAGYCNLFNALKTLILYIGKMIFLPVSGSDTFQTF